MTELSTDRNADRPAPDGRLRRLSLALYRALSHRNFRRMAECRQLIRWLDPQPRERILDVGCGDGFYDAEITRRGGSRVLGIDINEQRLAVANKRHASDRVEFRFMDAEEMSLDDESFDKAVSFCVIEHFGHDDRVLAHVRRALKPGGRLFLSADSLSNPELRDAERERHRRRYAVNTFYTPEILGRKLAEAGFEMQRTRYILTTPLSLALARLSWHLDDLPQPLLPVKGLGYLMLGTVGRLISGVSELARRRPDSGLTILASARKR
jgi:2-polyprenyl-3-methyl-5-hydroxy-6-metoxy-1,4-benzoquinol methylase